jgi:DNA-binding protein H-NS
VSDLSTMLKQKAELEAAIAKAQEEQREGALATIRSLMEQHGLSQADLFRKSKKGFTVVAKYRNKETGESWSGRGLQPKWLRAALAAGKRLDDFTV